MAQLDLFIVNVAVPDLQRAFGASVAGVSWTLNSYTIAFAAFLIPAGRVADDLGRERVFLGGVWLFTVASLICAGAPGLGVLIAGRAVEGMGAALLMPVSLALLLDAAAQHRHARLVGFWAAMGGTAAVLGPAVGGALLQLSWRWIFVVNVPIGMYVLVGGRKRLTSSQRAQVAELPDIFGALTLATTLVLLMVALVEADQWGWGSQTWLLAVAGLLLSGTAFAIQSYRHPRPLIEWSLLAVRPFGMANAAAVAFYVSVAAMLLGTFTFVQSQWGYSALRAGLAFAPGGLISGVCALSSGSWTRRFGRRTLMFVGPLFLALGGLWWLLFLGHEANFAFGFLPGVLLAGLGTGTSQAPLFSSVSALPAGRTATGSALLTANRQVSSALGVALFVLLLSRGTEGSHFSQVWMLVAGGALLASVIGAMPEHRR